MLCRVHRSIHSPKSGITLVISDMTSSAFTLLKNLFRSNSYTFFFPTRSPFINFIEAVMFPGRNPCWYFPSLGSINFNINSFMWTYIIFVHINGTSKDWSLWGSWIYTLKYSIINLLFLRLLTKRFIIHQTSSSFHFRKNLLSDRYRIHIAQVLEFTVNLLNFSYPNLGSLFIVAAILRSINSRNLFILLISLNPLHSGRTVGSFQR